MLREALLQDMYERLLEEVPHNIEAFIRLHKYYAIPFQDIIESKIWDAKEKSRLLQGTSYNKSEGKINGKNAIFECIRTANLSGFNALVLNHGKVRRYHYDESFSNIISIKEQFDAILNAVDEELEKAKEQRNGKTEVLLSFYDIIFSKLDKDPWIDEISEAYHSSLTSLYKIYLKIISGNYKASYTEFKSSLPIVNNTLKRMHEFYNDHIVNKYNPTRYLEYINKKESVDYHKLDELMTSIFINYSDQLSLEQISKLLHFLPNFNINYVVEDNPVFIKISDASRFVDDESGKVKLNKNAVKAIENDTYVGNAKFTGSFLQYAILKGDLPLVKLLKKHGGEFSFYLDSAKRDDLSYYATTNEMVRYLKGERENYFDGLVKNIDTGTPEEFSDDDSFYDYLLTGKNNDTIDNGPQLKKKLNN